MVLGTACQIMVGLLLEATRHEVSTTPALVHAAQALADADQAVQVAASRLAGAVAFPASGCAGGLCANRQAPAIETYDWQAGAAHTLAGPSGGAYWIELLGTVPAGQSSDCSGGSGGCEYVRVIASATSGGIRRTIEACYRIRRAGGVPPAVARISWRQTKAL